MHARDLQRTDTDTFRIDRRERGEEVREGREEKREAAMYERPPSKVEALGAERVEVGAGHGLVGEVVALLRVVIELASVSANRRRARGEARKRGRTMQRKARLRDGGLCRVSRVPRARARAKSEIRHAPQRVPQVLTPVRRPPQVLIPALRSPPPRRLLPRHLPPQRRKEVLGASW